MRPNRLVLLMTGLAGSIGGCSKYALNLDQQPCDNGQCLPGYVCNATTNLCDPEGTSCTTGTVTDCASCGDNCPTRIQNATPMCRASATGGFACDYDGTCNAGFVDADGVRNNGCECSPAGAEIPCNGIDDDCVGGDAPLTGDVHHCSGCADDCLAGANVTAAVCDTGGTTPICRITGCVSGWVDQNGDAADGCEHACTVTGAEICDGLDNDCNGIVDDVTPGSMQSQCDLRVPGSHVQTWICTAGACAIAGDGCQAGNYDVNHDWTDGCEYRCTPTSPTTEVCDNQDNDCNGLVDDIADPAPECAARYPGADQVAGWSCVVGDCEVQACAAGFIDKDKDPSNGCEKTCTPTSPSTEVCDGRDNDCNGTIDDVQAAALSTDCMAQFPDAVFVGAWACTLGSCAIASCQGGHWDINGNVDDGCEYACTYAGAETCNGVDDDCDGLIDVADPDLGTAAKVFADCSVRECAGCGVDTWACNAGACEIAKCADHYYDHDTFASTGCEYACNPTTPGPEVCDGEDNDCNGLIDTLDPALDTPAKVNNVCGGQNCTGCAVASWACAAGTCSISACTANHVNNDGRTDNGCEYACTPTVPPTEVCDGQDNDCNGATDTADPALDTQAKVNAFCASRRCSSCHVTTWSCLASGCRVGQCESGYFDTNGDPSDGCEGTCVYEGDAAFCTRVGGCGSVTANDNCGTQRTVACNCVAPLTCGGCGTPNVCGSWWNAAWLRRAPLTVTTTTAAMPAGYSVSLKLRHDQLVTANQSLANGNDLRVLWRNGTTWTEIDRVLDPDSSWNNANTTIWFKLQAAIPASSVDSSYFLYYGNSASGAPPANEGNVFHFADFFDRANAEALGNGWQQNDYPTTGAWGNIDLNGTAMYFSDASNTDNQPAAYHTFPAIGGNGTNGTWLWRFRFNWTRIAAENTYRIHMQLVNNVAAGGFPSTAPNAFAFAGAGPSLVSGSDNQANLTSMEGFGPERASTITQVAVVSGSHRIDVTVRLGPTNNYDLSIDGGPVTPNIPFSTAQTSLDSVRFFTWQLSAGAMLGQTFDALILRRVVTPEPTVALTSASAYSCP